MSISPGSILHDSTLYLRSVLASGIPDPISGSRISNGQFVMTSWPDRPTGYPLITIAGTCLSSDKLDGGTNQELIRLRVETRVWSKSAAQRDQLADQVREVLRSNQSGTEAQGLYGFQLAGDAPVDEPGKEGIHSMVQRFDYFFLTGS